MDKNISAKGGKTLVVFYSRTGTTKKVGNQIAEKLGADIEEIKDTVDRSGAKGYLISGRDAMKKRLTELAPLKFNPADYDLVIIGTPVWAWNMSSPIRTYLEENKGGFKKTAFFCTMGGTGDSKAFKEMEEIIGISPIATFSARTIDVVKDKYLEELEKFITQVSD